VVGFLDGTMLRTVRPADSALQRATYSGYLRGNGGKVLAIVAPDGMTMAAYGVRGVCSVPRPGDGRASADILKDRRRLPRGRHGREVRGNPSPPSPSPFPLTLHARACILCIEIISSASPAPSSASRPEQQVHRAVPGCVPRGGRSDACPRRGDGVRVEHAFGGVKNQVWHGFPSPL